MTPAAFAAVLRQAAAQAPLEVEAAMREGGMLLAGALIQDAIADTDPIPVDQAQYKASWSSRDVAGGAVVASSAKQAVWIERGRGPGPVPLAPIVEWVRRKGLAKAEVRAARRRASKRALTVTGLERVRRGNLLAIKASSRADFVRKVNLAINAANVATAHNKAVRKRAREAAKDAAGSAAEVRVAEAIRQSIAEKGYAPRRVLRRAMGKLRAPLLRMLKDHLGKSFAGGAA